jgi:hypothetical protein
MAGEFVALDNSTRKIRLMHRHHNTGDAEVFDSIFMHVQEMALATGMRHKRDQRFSHLCFVAIGEERCFPICTSIFRMDAMDLRATILPIRMAPGGLSDGAPRNRRGDERDFD